MNILFQEDGAFKTGVVLAVNTASLQVELPSGKRSKVKAANVLLRSRLGTTRGLGYRRGTDHKSEW